MPTNIVINNNTFAYPEPGDEPGWGPDATGAMVEVAIVLESLQGTDDIPETTFSIANNTAVAADIAGFFFNPATVRSAVIEYSIYRSSDVDELAEKGTLELIYKNGGTITEKWTIGRLFFGDDTGVEFTMLDNGQMQYTSTLLSVTDYSGILKFEAKVTQS